MPKPICHMSDQQLVAELPFSEDAFMEIYNRYWEKLLFVASAKLNSISLAEEVIQDVFVEIWRRRNALPVITSLEAYLTVAVKYRIINAHAKMKRDRDYISNQSEPVISGNQVLDEREIARHINLLVAALPEKCRLTYQLTREEGLTLRQTALVMSISQKAVEANLTRSLKLLRFGLNRILFSLLSLFPAFCPSSL